MRSASPFYLLRNVLNHSLNNEFKLMSYWALRQLSPRLIIYTFQFTWPLTPNQKKALAPPQCLSNKSQEEVILAHFLLQFKSLCNTKLKHLS